MAILLANDVFIGLGDDGSVRVPSEDDYWFADVFTHEIGHAIGLKHPFLMGGDTPPYVKAMKTMSYGLSCLTLVQQKRWSTAR